MEDKKILLAHGLFKRHSRESGNPVSSLPSGERTKPALSEVNVVRGNKAGGIRT
jgi:hypothetical protein